MLTERLSQSQHLSLLTMLTMMLKVSQKTYFLEPMWH
jgi:hypothetical protein